MGACIAHAGAEAADPKVGEAVQVLDELARMDFSLPDHLALDATLRQQVQSLADEHLSRLQPLFVAWAEEELRLDGPDLAQRTLTTHLLARYLNEFAMWQLDTTGEDFDRLTWKLLEDPGYCAEQPGETALAGVASGLQRLSPADQTAALAAERILLDRWGKEHPVAERPEPALRERVEPVLAKIRSFERPPQEPPMVPALAWVLLTSPPPEMADQNRCLFVQWWVQREGGQHGAAAAELLSLARYTLLTDPGTHLNLRREEGESGNNYPVAARYFEVEGTTVIGGRPQATGPGFDGVRVVQRQIVVPGIRGARPVAFEAVFDEASLAQAAKLLPNGRQVGEERRVRINWSLQ